MRERMASIVAGLVVASVVACGLVALAVVVGELLP